MNCPLETRDNAQLLLDYCARKLEPESVAILERHIALCSACREFASRQRAVKPEISFYLSEGKTVARGT